MPESLSVKAKPTCSLGNVSTPWRMRSRTGRVNKAGRNVIRHYRWDKLRQSNCAGK